MDEHWAKESKCKMCGELAVEESDFLLCTVCLEKLQTHYGQKCKKCGNHNFIKWTQENVELLAKKLHCPPDMLFHTDKIVILPYHACPKCNDEIDYQCTWQEEYEPPKG